MEWISTREQKPEENQAYLVLVNGNEPTIAYYGLGRLEGSYESHRKMWRNDMDDSLVYPDFLITHFIPIPKLNGDN